MAWVRGKILRCAKLLYSKRQTRLRDEGSSAFTHGFNAAAQRSSQPHRESNTNTSTSTNSTPTPATEATPAVQYSEEDVRQATAVVGDYLPDDVLARATASLAASGELLATATATASEHGADMRIPGEEKPEAEAAQAPRRAAWEADLELERETLAYVAGGVPSSSAQAPAAKVRPAETDVPPMI